MIKKTFCMFFTFIFVLFASPLISLAVEADPVLSADLSVSNTSGKIGEIVSVDFSINNNPGIAALRFYINYNTDCLKPISVTKGSVLTSGNIFSNISVSNISTLIVSWDNYDNVTQNGTMFTVDFEITGKASFQNYPITVTYNESDVCNSDFNDIFLSVTNGEIDVNGFDIIAPNTKLFVDNKISLKLTIDDDNLLYDNALWSSSDEKILTVDNNGNVTGVSEGYASVIATVNGISSELILKILPVDYIYYSGLYAGINKSDFENKFNFMGNVDFSYSNNGIIGTGTLIDISDSDDDIIQKYCVIIYGDVNGDGWYDGTDAITVSCLANGMLTREQVGEAVWMAADCNHDGVIDRLDVDLLNQAGVLLANIDQTKSEAELQTDSEYAEYLSLIDQQVDIPQEETTEDAPTPDDIEPLSAFIRFVIAIIKQIFAVIGIF